ncbi:MULTISPECIES: hypothetical protein [unclassified Streptomyces]|uniref:hypothetical protein n=1 Tax=unclassified Streptomyces TaxID=2593676 RepID=UPI0038301939
MTSADDPGPLLDWRGPGHWSDRSRPCRYCGAPTHLRDGKRRPAHKVCAEQALAEQAAEAANVYRTGQIR